MNSRDTLPPCVQVSLSNALVGVVNASQISPGPLPSGVQIGGGSIKNVSPSKLAGVLPTANTVSNNNIQVGSLPLSTLAR